MANLAKPNKSILRKGNPPKEEEASNNLVIVEEENTRQLKNVEPKIEKELSKPLNFKVPNSFRKRFKNFATNNDITMSDLLVMCFEQYEKKYNK